MVIALRVEQLDRFLHAKASGCGINFMAHSMDGFDCCHLIITVPFKSLYPGHKNHECFTTTYNILTIITNDYNWFVFG